MLNCGDLAFNNVWWFNILMKKEFNIFSHLNNKN